MQNKPNFPRFCAKNARLEEKQTQFKANSNPIKPKYAENKPNSKPIQTQSNPISNQSREAVPQFCILIFAL